MTMRKEASILFVCALVASRLLGMEAPRPGDIELYKADGSYEARRAMVEEIGNHRVHPGLAARTIRKLDVLSGKANERAPLPAWEGMPTTGTNDMLVILVEFPDYPSSNTSLAMNDHIFGDGDSDNYPRESLTQYYLRSSYGQLHIQGDILGWYMMPSNRATYEPYDEDGSGSIESDEKNAAIRRIVLEVIDAYDVGHDYSKYDNNGDNVIDYFAIIWTGPDNGWGNFWWGYQWGLYDDIERDGVKFDDFSWQWEASPHSGDFLPYVLIHETGHALGLPDYYDYDASQGPDGGVGGLDMMAGNKGDHNSFSKFMLDWMTPMLVNTGLHTKTLRALSQYPDSVAVMPTYDGSTPYTEYFMVENRYQTGNDTNMPSDGLLIWHVDATKNGSGNNFLYDNSYTSHKLLRLMEADGLEEIETGNGRGDAGDYYNQGEEFTPATFPDSSAYDGSMTYVIVTNISPDSTNMTASIAADRRYSPTVLRYSEESISQTIFRGQNGVSVPFDVWVVAPSETAYSISDDAAWLSIDPSSGVSSGEHASHDAQFNTSGLGLGSYDGVLTIVAPEAENSPVELNASVRIVGTNLQEATGLTNSSWRTGGDGAWIQQVDSSHDGVDAAEASGMDDSEVSWIEVDIEGPGDLDFWWKVSSEAGYDYLNLYVDGSLQSNSISGDSGWGEVELTIPPGIHTVRWSYEKDGFGSVGSDAAWLDNVLWTLDVSDKDEDGMLDWMESIAGTGLTDSNSIFVVSAIGKADVPDAVAISWESFTGRVYSVEIATNTTAGFTPLVSNLPSTPPLNVYTASLGQAEVAYFRVKVSELASGSEITLLEEYFASTSVPVGWQVVDEAGTGAVWTFDDPGGRGNRTGGTGNFAMIDSDDYGHTTVLTSLVSPSMNCSGLSSVSLAFLTDYEYYSGDEVRVYVVSGSSTQTVWSKTSSYSGPASETIDISAEAAGQSSVAIHFYYSGNWDWWWQVDNVKVTGVVE